MLNIHETQTGAIKVFKPQGPLTDQDVIAFKKLMMEAVEKTLGRFVIDLSAVPFIDSGGLEALVDVTQALSRAGQSLRLCTTTKTVREVLEITGLADNFEHYDDANGAVRSFL
jgi:anti-sigma B factor antagonist